MDSQPIKPDTGGLGVRWLPRDSLDTNEYNPSEQSGTDREVLKNSIIDTGWTRPILIRPDRTIVDGESRWFVSRHPDIREDDSLTPNNVPAGHVPVLVVGHGREDAMAATFQINTATGSHDEQAVVDVLEDLDDTEYGLDRIEMAPSELEIAEETGEDVSDVSFDESSDRGAYTETVEFNVADEKAIETHIDEITGERLAELARFILETASYEAVSVDPPDWDNVPE